MAFDRKREAHITLLNKITLQYLASNVSQGRNKKMFRGNARIYLDGDPEAEAREDPTAIMHALEVKGKVGLGRYEILKKIVQPIDVRMMEEIKKTEELLTELSQNELVETDDRKTTDCSTTIVVQESTESKEETMELTAAPDNGVIPQRMIYPINPGQRGRALIFCNVNVDGKPALPGYHKDASDLKSRFGLLGFTCDVLDDKPETRMKQALEAEQKEDHSGHSAFICCFLSHGNKKKYSRNDPNVDHSNENYIYSADSKEIYIDDVMGMFSAEKCPSLNGKPKWFIVQACRGTQDLDGHEVAAAAPLTPSFIPNFADTLLLNATVQDSKSWVSGKGSRLIQSLCKFLNDYHKRLDIMTICTLVCGEVADMGNKERKQMPEIRSTLRKILYLR